MKAQKGITLIELMVVVVIVAILAAIAVPSYSAYVVRANRRAAQSVMMELSTRQHQFFAANRAYASAADLNYTLPPEVSANYSYSVALSAGPPPAFTITMTPSGRQASDGALTLTSAGVKEPAGKW